jgi:hypothetical protein
MSNFINNANGYLSRNDKDITDENSSPLIKAFLNKLPINHLYDCTLNAANLAGHGQKIFPGLQHKPKPSIHKSSSGGLGKVNEESPFENFESSGQRFLSPEGLDQSDLGPGLLRAGWSKHKIPAESKRRWLPPDQLRKGCRMMANRQTRAVQLAKNFVDCSRENGGDFNSFSGITQMP